MLQVELRERRIWSSGAAAAPYTGGALLALQAQGAGAVRVYGHVGCGEVACRSKGWTVHHSAVVLVEDVNDGLQRLRSDAAAVRSYVRSALGGELMAGEFAVNVQVARLGESQGFKLETQVRLLLRPLCLPPVFSLARSVGGSLSGACLCVCGGTCLRPPCSPATALAGHRAFPCKGCVEFVWNSIWHYFLCVQAQRLRAAVKGFPIRLKTK